MKWRSQKRVALFIVIAQIVKVTGSGKATVVEISENDIEIFGNFKTFEKLGSDGSHVRRAFCPICGSQMFTFVRENVGALFVKVGTMDCSSWIRPVATCWASSASPWSPPDENIKTYEGNPPSWVSVRILSAITRRVSALGILLWFCQNPGGLKSRIVTENPSILLFFVLAKKWLRLRLRSD